MMDNHNTTAISPYHLAGQFVEGWMNMLELWDHNLAKHSRRVSEVSVLLARKCGWHDRELQLLEWGARLHDMGKVCIPPSILMREGPLSGKDWDIVKRHPVFGYEMLKPVEMMGLSANIVLCHHENWEGSGYPRSLKAEEIPLGARIVAVAEVWDALTSNPDDRTLWPRSRVIAYIREHAMRKFDPKIVAAFGEIVDSLGTY